MKRPTLLLFAILLAAHTLTMSGHIFSPDEEILFRATEAIATRGSTAIEPLLGFATRHPAVPRPDGREFAQYGVGQPLLAVPFYWLGRGLGGFFPAEAWVRLRMNLRTTHPWPPDGWTGHDEAELRLMAEAMAARFGVSLFNLLTTALTGVALFLLARRLCGNQKAAWIAALGWGLGSMAWPHSRTFFTEPLAGLCLLLSLYCLARVFDESRQTAERGVAGWTLAAGAAAGYGLLVRVDFPVFIPPLFLLVLLGDWRPSSKTLGSACGPDGASCPFVYCADVFRHHVLRREVIRRGVLFALPLLLAGGVILLQNKLRYGGFLESGYSDQPEGVQFSAPLMAGLYGFLMSVGKGLFFFSPFLVLAFWGAGPMLRRKPVFGAGLLLLFLLFLAVMSKWRNWAGGWCWGPRHIMQIHMLLAVPVAFWLAEGFTRTKRIAVAVLLLVGATVQIFGCSQNFIDFYQIFYQNPLPPTARALYDPNANEAIHHRFAILPRLPESATLRDETDPATLGLDPVALERLRPYALIERDPRSGRLRGETSAASLPAPINDSIYIVQNSQWAGYSVMWRSGLHDFFWLHLLQGAAASPRPTPQE